MEVVVDPSDLVRHIHKILYRHGSIQVVELQNKTIASPCYLEAIPEEGLGVDSVDKENKQLVMGL